ncbi:ADAT1 isoform 4 [Pongo abelii]|uniref:ADAT1 isoform 4 n=1 Tax=Pongo abelii TaxID=9601 RepID=A0A2J8VWQ7_PONAB|nr:ADAT1 isoform 4 [Pongo abelii]
MWTADEIAQLCYEHYGIRLPKKGKPEPNHEWTLLAAVVKIQSPADKACDTPDKPVQVTKEVVSMGTGTKCIGQSKMRKSGTGPSPASICLHLVSYLCRRRHPQ